MVVTSNGTALNFEWSQGPRNFTPDDGDVSLLSTVLRGVAVVGEVLPLPHTDGIDNPYRCFSAEFARGRGTGPCDAGAVGWKRGCGIEGRVCLGLLRGGRGPGGTRRNGVGGLRRRVFNMRRVK